MQTFKNVLNVIISFALLAFIALNIVRLAIFFLEETHLLSKLNF